MYRVRTRDFWFRVEDSKIIPPQPITGDVLLGKIYTNRIIVLLFNFQFHLNSSEKITFTKVEVLPKI
uniref:Putative ovule protein n=1 Tax=Solanum chacoense TaxID=4108 RepID=A0A0V0GZ26_SOLCH